MNEPILVTRSSMPTLEEYVEAIKPLWDSHWLTNMGENHENLKERLKEYLQVEGMSLFTNGHMALELLIQAMELTGEVITTPFTFASTTHAIVRNGLTPVFCDIEPETYTMDVEKIEALITDKTSAILPVHVYGNVCNVKEIEKIAERHHLKVIYDAAHAFGVKVNGEGVATFGDASMFSFHATKVFNTIEGGAITFSEPELEDRLHYLKNFGIKDGDVKDVGANAKMNEFQAAMGLCNLRHLEEEIQKRKKVVERYREHLGGVPGLKINYEVDNVKSNYSYFPLVIDEKVFGYTRDEVDEYLQKHEIYARKYFYPLTNGFECYKDRFDLGNTPVAEYVSERVLTLPLYADLSLETVDRICDLILNGIK